jgi:hypothetical protein
LLTVAAAPSGWIAADAVAKLTESLLVAERKPSRSKLASSLTVAFPVAERKPSLSKLAPSFLAAISALTYAAAKLSGALFVAARKPSLLLLPLLSGAHANDEMMSIAIANNG